MIDFKTIEWHEKCLSNSKSYELELSKELDELHKKLSYLRLKNIFYKEQIEQAKVKGKKTFDENRFMKKKGDKA